MNIPKGSLNASISTTGWKSAPLDDSYDVVRQHTLPIYYEFVFNGRDNWKPHVVAEALTYIKALKMLGIRGYKFVSISQHPAAILGGGVQGIYVWRTFSETYNSILDLKWGFCPQTLFSSSGFPDDLQFVINTLKAEAPNDMYGRFLVWLVHVYSGLTSKFPGYHIDDITPDVVRSIFGIETGLSLEFTLDRKAPTELFTSATFHMNDPSFYVGRELKFHTPDCLKNLLASTDSELLQSIGQELL